MRIHPKPSPSHRSGRICRDQCVFARLSNMETKASASLKERKKSRTKPQPIYENHTSLASGRTGFFDRLASTETVSFTKLKKSKNTDENMSVATKSTVTTASSTSSPLFDRLASSETFSSARLKERKSDEECIISVTPAAPSAFFDRLASSETFSSARLKERKNDEECMLPITPASPSAFFDRLASSETFSSARLKERKNVEEIMRPVTPVAPSPFFDRLASSETFASAGLKERKLEDDEDVETHVSLTSSAFFDRLAYSETYASAGLKERKPEEEILEDISPLPLEPSEFFNRLATSETFSSARLKERRDFQIKEKVVNIPSSNRKSPVFDRLASTDTISSAKRKERKTKEYRFVDEKVHHYSPSNSRFFERLAATETISFKKLKGQSRMMREKSHVHPGRTPPKTIKFPQSSSCSVSSCSSASTTISQGRAIRTSRYTHNQEKNSISVYDRLAGTSSASSVKKIKYREASMIIKDRLQSLEKPKWVY